MAKATPDKDVSADAAGATEVHLLDVGTTKYGDALLIVFGKTNPITVLIDGGHPKDAASNDEEHPSIPEQIGTILGTEKATVDLLIVTHAHQDHIGCLPALVGEQKFLRAKWALVADPGLGWGRSANDDAAVDADVDRIDVDDSSHRLAAALREEPLDPDTPTARLDEFIEDAAKLEPTYRKMLSTLAAQGTNVVRMGRDSRTALENAFTRIGLRIYGPSDELLLLLADRISELGRDAVDSFADALDGSRSVIEAYRSIISRVADAPNWKRTSVGPSINCQSIVVSFKYGGKKMLFSGDMQFAEPELFDDDLNAAVKKLRADVIQDGPFDFVKIGHHASYNAFDDKMLAELKLTKLFGIMNGVRDKDHPDPGVLDLLRKHKQEITWARTDRNGLTTLSFPAGEFEITRGRLNDARENIVDEAAPVSVVTKKVEVVPPEVRPPVLLSGAPSFVELTAKIPTDVRSVNIAITLERQGGPLPTDPFRGDKK